MEQIIDVLHDQDLSYDEFGLYAREELDKELTEYKRTHKARKAVMLASIPLCHAHANELYKLVNDEWQVDKLEQASGNVAFHPEWNPDIDNDGNPLEQLRPAGGFDSHSKEQIGIETSLYQHGILIRNIWDAVEIGCSLIVRHQGHWHNRDSRQSGKFDAEGYSKREARRLKEKHNRLMEYTGKHEAKVTANYDERKAKRLAKLARRSEIAANKRQLNKVGYNAFPVK